jgi:hypothetical protein
VNGFAMGYRDLQRSRLATASAPGVWQRHRVSVTAHSGEVQQHTFVCPLLPGSVLVRLSELIRVVELEGVAARRAAERARSEASADPQNAESRYAREDAERAATDTGRRLAELQREAAEDAEDDRQQRKRIETKAGYEQRAAMGRPVEVGLVPYVPGDDDARD